MFQVASTQEVAAAPSMSIAEEDQPPPRLSDASLRRIKKLVAEGVASARARKQVGQPKESSQTKRAHSAETELTDTAKRAKTGTPWSKTNYRKAGADIRVGVMAADFSTF